MCRRTYVEPSPVKLKLRCIMGYIGLVLMAVVMVGLPIFKSNYWEAICAGYGIALFLVFMRWLYDDFTGD